MPTKTIVIGSPSPEEKKLVPIQFKKYLLPYCEEVGDSCMDPTKYQYIELICKNYSSGYDLMFAYDTPEDRSGGTLYIGEWNDGIAG